MYFLPLDELKRKVNEFGEEFPEIYTFPLKFIAPIFGISMTVIAIYHEIVQPYAIGEFAAHCIGY